VAARPATGSCPRRTIVPTYLPGAHGFIPVPAFWGIAWSPPIESLLPAFLALPGYTGVASLVRAVMGRPATARRQSATAAALCLAWATGLALAVQNVAYQGGIRVGLASTLFALTLVFPVIGGTYLFEDGDRARPEDGPTAG
jgi:hypothetical protein